MVMRNTAEKWGSVARFFHWTMALLIVGLLGLGLVMGDLPREMRFSAFTLHKSFGLLALGLVVCRLVWRLTSRIPASLSGTPKWQVWAAEFVHWALYGLMLAIPATGYLSSSYGHYPFPFMLQPDWQVPMLTEANQQAREILGDRHSTLAWTLMAVLGVHIVAALYHHFVVKDPILARMTPFIRQPRA